MTDDRYLLAVDAPDPDNLALIQMAHSMFGEDNILGVLLTGRPVNLDADEDTPIEEFSLEESKNVQKINANRFTRFMEEYGIEDLQVYDGGIAPYTLVPHHLHFPEHSGFNDVDPLKALKNTDLQELDDLQIDDDFHLLVGGPMTGIKQLLEQQPGIKDQIHSLHAMYASLGDVDLMDMDSGEERGARQFNVACDPESGKYVTEQLDCPIYFITSDCTRSDQLAFETPEQLAEYLDETPGSQHLLDLYETWFEAAVEPRGEPIYIHDLAAAVSADSPETYDFEPMQITDFPTDEDEKDRWGEILFQPDQDSNIHVSTDVRETETYLELVREHL